MLVRLWQAFFYTPVDLTSLAVFRMLFGVLVVADAISYYRDVDELLAPDGFVSHQAWKSASRNKYFSVFLWLPGKRSTVIWMLLLYGVSGAAVSVGLMTRVATITTFLAGISIYQRNRHVLHSGDTLMRILNFLLVFSDAGHTLSMDDALGLADTHASAPAVLRLMQLQIAMMYLHAVRFKLKGRMWRRGTATHYATRLLTHRRRKLPPLLDTVTAHRVATFGTPGAEVAAGTLLWFGSTRYFAIAAIVVLHLNLQWFMKMHLFQWIMLASLVLFVPGTDIRAVLAAIGVMLN